VMQAPGRPDEDRRGGFEHGGWAGPWRRGRDGVRDGDQADRQRRRAQFFAPPSAVAGRV